MLFYAVHGVFWERTLELVVSVIATIIVMLYCIVEYAVQGHESIGKNGNLKLVSKALDLSSKGYKDMTPFNSVDIFQLGQFALSKEF